MQEINTLCLMGNSYGSNFFLELKEIVKKIKSIKVLILRDIFTTRTNDILKSLEIINEIFSNKNLQVLDLSDNAICPDGCTKIRELLVTNNSIKYLYLNHSALS